MEQVTFGRTEKTSTLTTGAAGSTSRTDNPEVSSRWDKVAAREQRQESGEQEDTKVGQTPPKKPNFVGGPKKAESQLKGKKVASPFDLFNTSSLAEQEGELAGLHDQTGLPKDAAVLKQAGLFEEAVVVDQAGISEMEISFVERLVINEDEGEINLFVDAEKSGLGGVGMVTEKKEESKVNLYEDLSYLASNASPVQIAPLHGATGEVESLKQPTVKTSGLMEELASRIVDEINIVKLDGRTDTTIQLKNVGIFTDAQVTITEFDTAKKEFNIRFENLTQQAHEILSMNVNRESLRSALEQKGYNVHIITANTQIEQAEQVYKGHQDRSGSDKQSDHQQNQEEQQQRKKK